MVVSISSELSLWGSGSTTVKGVWSFQMTPIDLQKFHYQYKSNIRALGLNALFDVTQWRKVHVLVGAGINLAEVSSKDYVDTPFSGGSPVLDNSVNNHTDTKTIFDFKVGAGMNFQAHWQANFLYTYYPTFSYHTGDINSLNERYGGIKSDMSMQTAVFDIAHTF